MEKTRELLQKFDQSPEPTAEDHEYTIRVIEGKQMIIGKTKIAVDTACFAVNICTTPQRWVTITQGIYDNVKDALNRGVKFKAILAVSDFCLPNEFRSILLHPNYEVRLFNGKLKSNSAIFDGKIVSFNFYPSKNISDSPMIWTNHPSFLVGSRLYFKSLWGKTKNMFDKKEQRFL